MTLSTRTTASAMAAVALALALSLTGCSNETDGAPTAAPRTSTSTSTTSAATTTTTMTTAVQQAGLRTDAPSPTITVNPVSGSRVDEVIEQTVSDADGFWAGSETRFFPPKGLQSLSAPDTSTTCRAKLHVIRACGYDIIWEAPEMSGLHDASGDLGVMVMFAHEVGHFVQNSQPVRPDDLSERGADCLAGVYAQSVANGSSKRFAGSRAEIESAAEAAFRFGETPDTPPTERAAYRVVALQAGLDHTAGYCLEQYK